jgi:selenocysteine-specific elongation factor
MNTVVIGTAGHIDHGKSALVRALTGIDPDRLPEEKRRGITIELGFAYLQLSPEWRASLVDVPGHEKFVHTMVAGTSGIDLVMLVVAADEGVMPQTREHLDICQLLGLKRGLVVVNKIDLLDSPEGRNRAIAAIREELRGTFLADAPLLAVSATSGEGLEQLRAKLLELAQDRQIARVAEPAFLAIDRVFAVAGFGTVVTGTLTRGELKEGELVDLLPDRRRRLRGIKIRGLQVHGKAVDRAAAGQRVAVNLSGVSHEDLRRGQVLASAGWLEATRVFDALLQTVPGSPPLRSGLGLVLYAGTDHSEVTVNPLGTENASGRLHQFARLRCRRELALLPGQHFILRGGATLPGRGNTWAGGVILQLDPPLSRRLSRPRRLQQLERLAGSDVRTKVQALLENAGRQGLNLKQLALQLGRGREQTRRLLEEMAAEKSLLLLGEGEGRAVSGDEVQRLLQSMVQKLQDFHRSEPLLAGMGSEQLRSSLAIEPALFQALQHLALEQRLIARSEGLLSLAGHRVSVEQQDQKLIERLAARYQQAGLSPPTAAEAAAELGCSPPAVTRLLQYLVREGKLLRISRDIYCSAEALAGLRTRLIDFLKTHGEITIQQFKQLVGASRKYAISLAEYFDGEKLTARRGNVRVWLGRNK